MHSWSRGTTRIARLARHRSSFSVCRSLVSRMISITLCVLLLSRCARQQVGSCCCFHLLDRLCIVGRQTTVILLPQVAPLIMHGIGLMACLVRHWIRSSHHPRARGSFRALAKLRACTVWTLYRAINLWLWRQQRLGSVTGHSMQRRRPCAPLGEASPSLTCPPSSESMGCCGGGRSSAPI